MKKLIALIAASAFVLSMATMASAAHQGRANLQTSGFIQTGIGFADNMNFEDDDSTFVGDQRVRQYFNYIASENLKATVGYEFDTQWGAAGQAPVGADQSGLLELKRANLEFTWPGTETTVKSGIQFISLPGVAMGYNPVLAGDMAGVAVTAPLGDMADLTVGWTRGYDNGGNDAAPGLDTFFAALPISQDGFSVAPFAAYSAIGNDANLQANTGFRSGLNTPAGSPATLEDAYAYWAGSNFEVNQMDPIGIKASLIYGSLQADQDINERSGWYADFSVDYNMEMMTPEVFAMYSSGEDDDASDGSETMPFVWNDGLTSKAPSMMIGDMTTLGITSAGVGLLQANPVGLWITGFSLKHITLTDKLQATMTASYYGGTNDKDANLSNMDNALTEEDNAYDVTLNTNYSLYENLSAIMEAGYAAVDYDESVWGKNYKDEPATRFALGLNYSF